MSTTKSLTKAAREAIDRRDHLTALRLCETGLENEDDNYMLLVLKALALQNLDRKEEAVLAYRKAAKVQPEHILAWQVLSRMDIGYRATGEASCSFYKVSYLMIDSVMLSDTERVVGCTLRLLAAYEGAGRLEQCLALLPYLRKPEVQSLGKISIKDTLDREIELGERIEADKINKEAETRRYRLGADPFPILKEKVTMEVLSKSNLEKTMLERLQLEDDSNLADKIIDRLKTKIPLSENKKSLTRDLLKVAQEHENSSQIAKALILDFTDWEDIFLITKTTLGSAHIQIELNDQNNNSNDALFVSLGRTLHFWNSQDYQKSREWCKCSQNLAIKYQKNFEINLSNVLRQLRRLEGLLYSANSQFIEAIPLLKEAYADNDKDVIRALINCYRAIEDHAKVISLYKILLQDRSNDANLLSDLGWEYYLVGDFGSALEALRRAQSLTDESDSMICSRLGIVCWHENESNRLDRDICFKYFIAACKADQTNHYPFLYLGKYYQGIETDLGRAEKCYRKVLSLNESCIEAALDLTQLWLLRANDRCEHYLEILQQIVTILEPFVEEHMSNARLWMYLGTAFAEIEKYSNSIRAYQNALKGNRPDQERCLLGLAESYRKSGKFVAATKAYQRVLELSPDSLTAQIGLGMVQIDLEEYEGARDRFKAIETEQLEIKNFVQLEAIRAGYFYCRFLIENGCIKIAFALIRELMEELHSLMTVDMRALGWKILADLVLLVWMMSNTHEVDDHFDIFDTILSMLEDELANHEIWDQIVQVLPKNHAPKHLLMTAVKVSCLCHVKIIIDSNDDHVMANSWTDLAISLLHVADSKHKGLLSIIVGCGNQAVSGSVVSSSAWVARGLALLYLGQYGVSQHCFIKAITKGSKEGWLNLALLYYRIGDLELSRKALQRIQIEHAADSALAWLYEAMIDKTEGKQEYQEKIIQAADLASICYDHVHMVYVLVGPRNDGMSWNDLVGSIKKRLAFYPIDKVANAVLRMQGELVPRPQDIMMMAKNIAENSADMEMLKTSLLQFDELDDTHYRGDIVWMKSLVFFLLAQPLSSLNSILNFIERRGAPVADQAWEDLQYWFNKIYETSESSAREDVVRLLHDWFRLRITPDSASKIQKVRTAEIIRELWGEKIPKEILKIVNIIVKFNSDLTNRKLNF